MAGFSDSAAILIVDDQFEVLTTIATYLKQVGAYEITIYRDPGEALRALEEQKFDLVISDIRMPRYDGLAVLEKVKRFQGAAPLIFMTGYADIEVTIKALKMGAFDFLLKPVDFEILHRSIKRALAEKLRTDLEMSYLTRVEDDVLTKTAQLRNTVSELEQLRNSTLEAHQEKLAVISRLGFDLQDSMKTIVVGVERLSSTCLSTEQLMTVEALSGAVKKVLEQAELLTIEAT